MEKNLNNQHWGQYDWYHTIEFKNGTTKGRYDFRKYIKKFNFPDLRNKHILDVGAGNGYFSFEFEKMGGIVTALDIPSQESRDNHNFGKKNIENKENTIEFKNLFNLAKMELNSNIKLIEENLYNLTADKIGLFDVIFCNDVLLHLTDPLKALSVLKSICKERIIIGTPIYTNKRKIVDYFIQKESLAYFMGDTSGGAFWLPNLKCLENMIKAAGFEIEKSFIMNIAREDGECIIPRGIIHAKIQKI